jgi:DNA-binding MarR family transcriptional regulator
MRHIPLGGDPAADAADLRDRLYAILRQLDRSTAGVPALSDSPTVKRINAILKARTVRAKFFDPDLFADPAWDMLLELYAAELSGTRISVSNLSISAAVPATTALRWMRVLEERGLLQRQRDQFDARRVFISLTPQASEAMKGVLTALPFGESLL